MPGPIRLIVNGIEAKFRIRPSRIPAAFIWERPIAKNTIFNFLHCLQLHQQRTFDEHVQAVLANINPSVLNPNAFLLLKRDTSSGELHAQGFFVDRFDESRPECLMNSDGRFDDPATQFLISQFSHFQPS